MMNPALKRDLRARANPLKCLMTIGKAGLSEPVLAGVRKLFENHDLIKIRVLMDSADDAELAGMELAERIPCELVGRLGRVLILYKKQDD